MANRDSLQEVIDKNTNTQGRFGAFGGVFTPCVLTILGVIMFMRAGFVVGYAGLWATLAILIIAKIITTLTTISIAAIASNIDMRVGGVYFMISRVLGPDFGGSIGITLFAANAVGVAFYTIGFTEALMALLGLENIVVGRIISTVMVGGLFVLTFKGAEMALRAQYIVLIILLLAVVSFLVGGFMDFDAAQMRANVLPSKPVREVFWPAFAIFFPAATGITAGANMSGDLKNPGKAIPRGTLIAILFTAIVYGLQLVLTAGSSRRGALIGDGYQALQDMSVFFPLIIAGVFAATLSSALGSFLGAPRILQAMGQDRLMKAMVFFGKGEGANNEPRRATVMTFVIAVAVIWAGDLNAVAEVISMFFLIAYGMINLSAFVESKSANPSFRPRFRFFHWGAALGGAIACGIAMVKINETYAIVALGITGVIYFVLKKRDIKTSYGDAKRGYIFQNTRNNLFYLERTKPHPKNWRPILSVVTENALKDAQLIRAASWLESNRGLLTVSQILERPAEDLSVKMRHGEDQKSELERQLEAENILAFSEAVVVDEFYSGLATFLQSYSIGGLRPNTLVVSMPMAAQTDSMDRFYGQLDVLAASNSSLVVYKPGDIALGKKRRVIDLWWRGEKNGSLMALFAYLITLNPNWSGAKVRIMRIVNDNQAEASARKHLNALKENIRMDAQVKVIRTTDDPKDVIASESGPLADLVLLGMAASSGEEAKHYIEMISPLLDRLPASFLIWSNGEADIFA